MASVWLVEANAKHRQPVPSVHVFLKTPGAAV